MRAFLSDEALGLIVQNRSTGCCRATQFTALRLDSERGPSGLSVSSMRMRSAPRPVRPPPAAVDIRVAKSVVIKSCTAIRSASRIQVNELGCHLRNGKKQPKTASVREAPSERQLLKQAIPGSHRSCPHLDRYSMGPDDAGLAGSCDVRIVADAGSPSGSSSAWKNCSTRTPDLVGSASLLSRFAMDRQRKSRFSGATSGLLSGISNNSLIPKMSLSNIGRSCHVATVFRENSEMRRPGWLQTDFV